ncbi:MAG TPA: MerR family transcriptional regulator [Mycobacteriales bacterium]|jgi:Predicted transcriptional regulators
MRIGEVARRAGVSTRALRYYEQQDLLHSSRQSNGYREYDEAAVVRVRNIGMLLGAGLSCVEIRQLGECLGRDLDKEPVCPELIEICTRRLHLVEDRIAALRDVHQRIQNHINKVRPTATR